MKFTPIDIANDPIIDEPIPQDFSTPTLQGGVSFVDNIKKGFTEGVEAPQPVSDFFNSYDRSPVGKFINEVGPYFAMGMTEPQAMYKAAEPAFGALKPVVQKAFSPINPFLSKGFSLAKNAASGINNATHNAFNKAGDFLLDRYAGVKVSNERPIGLGQMNLEPAPVPQKINPTYPNMAGITEQAGTPYKPNFNLQGNNLAPTNLQLPAVRPNDGIPIGDAFYNYRTVRPSQPQKIGGLLSDNLIPNTSYRNIGTGKEGIYGDLSKSTGFNLEPEIKGLLPLKGSPSSINAEELLKNYIQNGGRINPANTTFKGQLSPSQTQAYENYFKQVFPQPGQQKLF